MLPSAGDRRSTLNRRATLCDVECYAVTYCQERLRSGGRGLGVSNGAPDAETRIVFGMDEERNLGRRSACTPGAGIIVIVPYSTYRASPVYEGGLVLQSSLANEASLLQYKNQGGGGYSTFLFFRDIHVHDLVELIQGLSKEPDCLKWLSDYYIV